MIRALVIDDEKPSREELIFLLSQIDEIDVVGEADDGIEAMSLIERRQPDLLFLDIQMPELSGIELAESLKKMSGKPSIIFTTAYDDYALQAFEVGAVDYLLKPYNKGRLAESLERIKEFKGKSSGGIGDISEEVIKLLSGYKDGTKPAEQLRRITVIKGDTYRPLCQENIVAVIASGKKSRIVTTTEEYQDNRTLQYLEEILDSRIFFKCHRSYLVNISHIEKIGLWFNNTYQLSVKNLEEKIPVSRSRIKEFRNLMAIE